MGQAMKNFAGLSNADLSQLQTISNQRMQPYMFQQQQQQGMGNLGSNLLSQLIGASQGLTGQYGQSQTGNASTSANLINQLLGNQTQLGMQESVAKTAAAIASAGANGASWAQILNEIMNVGSNVFNGLKPSTGGWGGATGGWGGIGQNTGGYKNW